MSSSSSLQDDKQSQQEEEEEAESLSLIDKKTKESRTGSGKQVAGSSSGGGRPATREECLDDLQEFSLLLSADVDDKHDKPDRDDQERQIPMTPIGKQQTEVETTTTESETTTTTTTTATSTATVRAPGEEHEQKSTAKTNTGADVCTANLQLETCSLCNYLLSIRATLPSAAKETAGRPPDHLCGQHRREVRKGPARQTPGRLARGCSLDGDHHQHGQHGNQHGDRHGAQQTINSSRLNSKSNLSTKSGASSCSSGGGGGQSNRNLLIINSKNVAYAIQGESELSSS